MRTDINGLLWKLHVPRPNLTKEENKGLVELKRDKDRTILSENKGAAMVDLDKKDYIEKAQELLAQPTYRTIERDPTNKLKAKLITILRIIKRDTRMEEKLYKVMYPTGCTPKLLWFAQNLQNMHPLRPFVLSMGSVTNGVAEVLAKVRRSMVGKSPHHIQSPKDFVNKVNMVTLLLGECLCSYDVLALFTSVAIDPALNVITKLLKEDTTL